MANPAGDHAAAATVAGSMTLPEILSEWARQRPDAVAFDFVGSELTVHDRVSFQELEGSAKRVAAFLQSSVRPGDRVLLLLPPGIEYIDVFLGCLYAGVVAVPLYPPRPGASGERISSVLGSCRPSLVLTMDATVKLLRDMPSFTGPNALVVQTIDNVLAAEHGPFREFSLTGTDLAFLQYTSGSTGQPKGVMVSHRNLVENEKAIAAGFGIQDGDVVLSWLPLYHDMGLIGTTLLPLFLGLRTVLLNTFEFIHDPLGWPLAVARFGATCSGGPHFAYQLLVNRYDADRLAGVDLGKWRIAFNGAEPVHHPTLEEFAVRYGRHGFNRDAFYPCYGLAESTLFVSGGRRPGTGYQAGAFDRRAIEQGWLRPAACTTESMVLVSSGAPCDGTSVVIRNEAGEPLAEGAVGEICVQGPSVAQGYWDDPAATAETFRAQIHGRGGTFLRTGDLGALQDGQLYVVGRTKDLIIVAGRNFYPPDLAAAGSRVDADLRHGGATAFELPGSDPAVVLVLELERGAVARLEADPDAVSTLGEAVRREVAVECELDLAEVVFVRPGSIPRTSSGKIRTGETRARFLQGELMVVGRFRPGQPLHSGPVGQQALPPVAGTKQRSAAVRAVLEQAVSQRTGRTLDRADLDRPLAALGMDSLMLVTLRGAVERRLGHEVDAMLFFGDRSINDVADAVGAAPAHQTAPAPAAPSSGSQVVPASAGQVQQQFYAELFPNDTANNLPWALRFATRLDEQRLRAVVTAIVARHPALRTTLGPLGSNTQIVHQWLEPEWQVLEVESEDPAQVRQFFTEVTYRAFDLTRGPLVRVAAVLAPNTTMLLIACHHAVVDYWSLEILMADLVTGIGSGDLPVAVEPDATAAGWAQEQARRWAATSAHDRVAALAARWRPLRNEVLFPAPHRATRRNAAGTVDFEVGGAAVRALYERSSNRGCTPFVTVTAAYLSALHHVTGRRRIVIGTPHHGRPDWRFTRTVGYFVNLLPLLGEFGDGERIDALEERTWHELRRTLGSAEVPFPRLIKALAPDRHEQNPLFQATLTFQQSADGRFKEGFAIPWSGCTQTVAGLQLASLDVPPHDVAFALSLYGARDGERMVFRLAYQRDLLNEAVARQVCEEFTASLTELLATPASRLAALKTAP